MSNTQYEMMVLTEAELDEAGRSAIFEKARNEVTKGGGTFGEIKEWGRRKLAYPIKKRSDAFYSLAYFESDGDTLAETVHLLRITDGVMRVMAVNRIADLPEGVVLEGISDDELASGERRGSRGRGGSRGGRGRDRD